MKLSDLLADFIILPEKQAIEVRSLCLSSQDVKPGAVFFAYPGERADGRNYIEDAIKKGAVAVVMEEKNCPPLVSASMQPCAPSISCLTVSQDFDEATCQRVPIISIPNLQSKIGPIAQKFYDYPSKAMLIIGVTGTSGKTSVTNMIAQLLNLLGKRAYVMGTFGFGFPEGPFIETGINTPDPIRLQEYFVTLKQEACEILVMEVSSHALSQSRVQGLVFETVVFTNLTQDHLDYHQTMASYGAAKERLLTEHHVKNAVFNLEDPWSANLYQRYQHAKFCVFGVHSEKFPSLLEKTPLRGEFNRQNLAAAVTCLLSLGYDEAKVLSVLPGMRSVPGRLETIDREGFPLCIVDYAHKPDALEKALLAARGLRQGKLFCVFGCGGNRDKGKRPLMGRIAECFADEVCITDDNPREEDSSLILEQILSGFSDKTKVRVVPDRAQAIVSTIALAGEHDIVLVAGKGHEDYQLIGDKKKFFSDKAVILEAIEGCLR